LRDHFHQDIRNIVKKTNASTKENVVITDCRFPNKTKLIKQHTSKVKTSTNFWYDDAIIANTSTDPIEISRSKNY